MLDLVYASRRWSPPNILDSPESSLEAILNDPHRYVGLVEKTFIERYVMLAAAVIMLWDWLTRMNEEMLHIWAPRVRTGGSTLYLFIRYGGMAFQALDCAQLFGIWRNTKFCTPYFYLLPISTALLIYAVDMLLAYRALCLYRLKRTLVIATSALFGLSVVGWAILSFMAYGSFKAVPTPQYLTGCWSLMGGFIFFSIMPALLFEFYLFVLVVYRVISWSRAIEWNRQQVLRLLYKDSISWFLVIQAMILWNVISLGILPVGLRLLAISPFRAAITVCGCRLIINMRQAADAHTSAPWMRASMNRTVDGGPNGPEEASDSDGQAEALPAGAAPWLHLAKRIGLPPPLQSDFESPWYEPVMTLNKPTQTIMDRLHEASRPLPDQPPGTMWSSSMGIHNVSWAMEDSRQLSSMADGSIAFCSMDSIQTSGKAGFLDVDEGVERPITFAKAKRKVSEV